MDIGISKAHQCPLKSKSSSYYLVECERKTNKLDPTSTISIEYKQKVICWKIAEIDGGREELRGEELSKEVTKKICWRTPLSREFSI